MSPAPGARRPGGFSVVDTTELRWFFVGPLPPDLREWFAGSSGVAEQRRDTYLLHGRHDIGLKRRFGHTLELEVRQSLEGWVDLGDCLAGSLEVWRKWSPADGPLTAAQLQKGHLSLELPLRTRCGPHEPDHLK